MARRISRRAAHSAGSLMLAPAVIGMRMPLLLAEAEKGGYGGPETMRAVAEKATAFAQGAFAAQASLMRSAFDFWPQAMTGRVPSLLTGEAYQRAMEAASGPIGSAVKANFSRLGRAKKS
jgi:hypothetical protein